ncbi:hypothetical protein [Aestuariivita sp.]|jgi:hypothetical protein|uniref:hypothetical protein n=1 Tax=Aestuariivita sp. TaxID=1872407 RepID=UPI002172F8E7|nr:hypothetical protein [Aestuariivita sp.]MCE8006324.1 hypothetical protein [Aestuariivita sp.]
MTDFAQDDFDRWLAANTAGGNTGEMDPALRLLGSLAEGTPVVLNSTLTGAHSQQALEKDAAYSSAPAGDPAIEALKQSPATGASMIMTLAQAQSGYNPSDPAQLGSASMFVAYVNQVLQCPLYSAAINDLIQLDLQGSWDKAIDQIVSYYVGIPQRDLDTIRQSLVTIAAAASSNPSTNQVTNLFAQTTLSAGDDIDAYLYQSNVVMRSTRHSGGKNQPDYTTNQTNMTLHRVQLRFDQANWPDQAANVYAATHQSLADWLAGGSTPTGDLPDNWAPR